MRRFLRIGTILASLAALATLAPAATDWLLRLRLAEGATHRFALNHSQSMNFEMGGVDQVVENRSRFEFSQTVAKGLTEDSFGLDTVYERLQSEMSIGEMKLEFDTNQPEASHHPMAKMQRAMQGKHFLVSISTLGEVGKIDGLDAIFEAMTAEFADDPSLQGTLDVVREGFGEKSMKTMMQQSAMHLPEKRVKPGDGWQRNSTIPNPALGELRIVSDYRVEGAETVNERDCVKITVSSTIEFGGEEKMFGQLTQLLGTEIDAEVSSAKGQGTIWVDPATGLVVQSEMTQEVELALSMNVAGTGDNPAQTMEMNGAIVETFGIELLE